MHPALVLILATVLTGSGLWSQEGDVVCGWRGDGTGVFPGCKPPVGWSEAEGAGIRWRVELPTRSSSAPIHLQGCIVTLGEPDRVFCFDAEDGSLLWETRLSALEIPRHHHEASRALLDEAWFLLKGKDLFSREGRGCGAVGVGESKRLTPAESQRCKDLWREIEQTWQIAAPGQHDTGWTCATPITDGERIFVKHLTGVIGALDADGEMLWLSRYFPPGQSHLHKSYEKQVNSPVIAAGLVITCYTPEIEGHHGNSFESLVAFDPRSGAEVWRSDEPVRTAGWLCSSPVCMRVDDTDLVITGGGGVFRASDGALLAKGIGWCGSASSPTVAGDTAYFIDCESHSNGKGEELRNRSGARLTAARLALDGGRLQVDQLFSTELDGERHMPSPLVVGGKVFIIKNSDLAYVLDAETGAMLQESFGGRKKIKAARLRIKHAASKGTKWNYPSPVAAAGHVYWPRTSGLCLVTKPDAALTPVTTNQLDDRTLGSPLVVGNHVYIRGDRHLYCLGR